MSSQQQSGDVRRICHKVCGGFTEAWSTHLCDCIFQRFKIHFQSIFWLTTLLLKKRLTDNSIHAFFFYRMLLSQSCRTFHRNTSDSKLHGATVCQHHRWGQHNEHWKSFYLQCRPSPLALLPPYSIQFPWWQISVAGAAAPGSARPTSNVMAFLFTKHTKMQKATGVCGQPLILCHVADRRLTELRRFYKNSCLMSGFLCEPITFLTFYSEV